MKKFLFSALFAFPLFLGAQTSSTVTFEDLTLAVDTFYNGSDNAGHFVSDGATFNNTYDAEYAMWSGGFAYSNMRNDSTAGFTNMYSASPASGAESSSTYALFNPGFGTMQTMLFDSPVQLNKISFTNTTYAYLSMRDGDAYSKKFGSNTNAAGEEDGTNGKDFFYITVYALGDNNEKIDSTEVYLADFRSDNADEHFILNTWKEVAINLTASKFSFKLTSSDNGEFGMNTPSFFALDNIVYSATTTGIADNISIQPMVYPNPARDFISINQVTGNASIYSINGVFIESITVLPNQPVSIANLNPGVYFITINNQTIRFIKE